MHVPPVVCKYIEDAQYNDEESRGPLRLEPDGDHDTSSKTNNGYKHASDTPFTLEDEAKEKENQKNASCKEETKKDAMRSLSRCDGNIPTIFCDPSRL